MGELGSLAISYAAGVLSTLSPCVLPLLPIILFGMLQQHAWGPLSLAAGLSVSFAAIGIFVASIGFGLGINSDLVRIIVAALMVMLGIVLMFPALHSRLMMIASPHASGGHALMGSTISSGIRGPFLLGIMLGAVWSPCSGPTLGAAVGLAAQSDTMLRAVLVMAIFSLGASTPILALAYGSRRAITSRRDQFMRFALIAKPTMGAAMVAVGAFVLTGLDKIVEASLTRAMPDWLVTVTTRL